MGKRWLEQALEDLNAARYNLAGGKFYLVCFLCQQLSEKALKAYLYSKGEEIVLGHSVVSLCTQASVYDQGFSGVSDEAGRGPLRPTPILAMKAHRILPGQPGEFFDRPGAPGCASTASLRPIW